MALSAIITFMKQLMTRHFSKWALKQNISERVLLSALSELQSGVYDANLGGHIYKKRVAFPGHGKSGSGRTIICYKKNNRAIFVHGFAKHEQSDLTPRELTAFKALAKVLVSLSDEEIELALDKGDFKELKL